MEKIRFRLVYNRKKSANKNGCALIQIEAYQHRNRTYVSTNIYVRQNQWNKKKQIIMNHSNADELNMLLYSSIIELEKKEILLWKQGYSMNPKQIKSILHANYNESCNYNFPDFMYKCITTDSVCESTRKNRMTTLKLLNDYIKVIERL